MHIANKFEKSFQRALEELNSQNGENIDYPLFSNLLKILGCQGKDFNSKIEEKQREFWDVLGGSKKQSVTKSEVKQALKSIFLISSKKHSKEAIALHKKFITFYLNSRLISKNSQENLGLNEELTFTPRVDSNSSHLALESRKKLQSNQYQKNH